MLLDATCYTSGLATIERFGGKVVYAGHETVIDEVAEELFVFTISKIYCNMTAILYVLVYVYVYVYAFVKLST